VREERGESGGKVSSDEDELRSKKKPKRRVGKERSTEEREKKKRKAKTHLGLRHLSKVPLLHDLG